MTKSEYKTQRIKGTLFGEMPRVAIFSSSMRDFLMHIVEFNVGGKKKKVQYLFTWSCLVIEIGVSGAALLLL